MNWNRPPAKNTGFAPKKQFSLKASKGNPESTNRLPKPNSVFATVDNAEYRPSLRFTAGGPSEPQPTADSPLNSPTTSPTSAAGQKLAADSALSPTSNQASHEAGDSDEADPLDAFMAGIDKQVHQEAQTLHTKFKTPLETLENDDPMDAYLDHLKKRDAAAEEANLDHSQSVMDAGNRGALSEHGDSNPLLFKKEIVPLSQIDHAAIDYLDIEKCFYIEHDDIAKLSDQEVCDFRRQWNIHVSGASVPKPCLSFGHFGFDEDLMGRIAACGYTEPTAIQKQAIPVAMAGRDIIGIAKTGSGKTAAFVLPMLVHLMDQPELKRGEGPIGLVLAPTRELAHQIHREAKRFAQACGAHVAVVYGGMSKTDQFKELRGQSVDILVATPGRLIDLVKMKATNLHRVSYLVLDEADRMFDLGFEPQVRSVCDRVRPDRQTLLFSATFPRKIERLALQVTSNDAVRVNIGHVGEANTDVTQKFHVVTSETAKWDWLEAHVAGLCAQGSVLIFISRVGQADILADNLTILGWPCGALHGNMLQGDRDRVLREFKSGKTTLLAATDVAARGLDIKTIKTVLNFDVARDIDSHVHRIGRTGRAGEKGTAITLLMPQESRMAGDLVRQLELVGEAVPPELYQLAMNNARFRQSRDRLRSSLHGNRLHRGRGPGQGRGRGRGRGSTYHQRLLENPGLSTLTAGAQLSGDRRGLGSQAAYGFNSTPHRKRPSTTAFQGSRMSFVPAQQSAATDASLSSPNHRKPKRPKGHEGE
ncbi:hypothetical protein H4R34_002355 [Dimargaris verticillata]|uniref:RNA helicase n=1 Tax=Dimargaris verticillata TaxID=2761393 RepID=A0A9W8B895_9FUNG|nr:hypothetical protein H4R34_002355 [Dimargaris verticillata]